MQWKCKQYGEFMEEGKRAFTLYSVDPLANSWIYSDCAPNLDPHLELMDYDCTWEEDEALDLHNMVVEKKKKMENAAKDVVEKDSRKEQELEEKKESVISCVFVQPSHSFAIPPDIQTLFIQYGRR